MYAAAVSSWKNTVPFIVVRHNSNMLEKSINRIISLEKVLIEIASLLLLCLIMKLYRIDQSNFQYSHSSDRRKIIAKTTDQIVYIVEHRIEM